MRQVVKQVIDGVEKLLIVEVVEELEVDKLKQEYEQLQFDFDGIQEEIKTHETSIKTYENNIEELKKTIETTHQEIVQLLDTTTPIVSKMNEIKDLLNQILPPQVQNNGYEQLALPIETVEEIKGEETVEEVEQEVKQEPRPGVMVNARERRFGRFGR